MVQKVARQVAWCMQKKQRKMTRHFSRAILLLAHQALDMCEAKEVKRCHSLKKLRRLAFRLRSPLAHTLLFWCAKLLEVTTAFILTFPECSHEQIQCSAVTCWMYPFCVDADRGLRCSANELRTLSMAMIYDTYRKALWPYESLGLPTHWSKRKRTFYTLTSLRFWLARNARAYTSARSIGFCVIWVCISSSSSSIRIGF